MSFIWPDTLIEVVTIAVLALVIRGLLKRLINRWIKSISRRANGDQGLSKRASTALSRAGNFNTSRQEHRARTLGSMLCSVIDALIVVIAIFMILQAFGLNIMPALASAGIGGIALGFGAQTLVKDTIAGLFLMLEDQLGVGDYIDIGQVSGTVLSLALRATRVRADNGEIWYIRNGEIATLGNRTQGWSSGTIEIPVDPNERPQQVLDILTAVTRKIEEDESWHSQMIEPPTVLGLTRFHNGQAIYAIVVKCPGNSQWGLERETRMRAVAALQDAGIAVAPQSAHPSQPNQ